MFTPTEKEFVNSLYQKLGILDCQANDRALENTLVEAGFTAETPNMAAAVLGGLVGKGALAMAPRGVPSARVLTPAEIAEKQAHDAAEAQKAANEIARKKRESLNDLGLSTGRVNHAQVQREDALRTETPTAKALREMRAHADETVAALDKVATAKAPAFVPLRIPADATPAEVSAILKTGSIEQIKFHMKKAAEAKEAKLRGELK
ncbi:MAG TPA: hypothetical protein VGD60_11475 [Candidatus Acidoferrales bacterium]